MRLLAARREHPIRRAINPDSSDFKFKFRIAEFLLMQSVQRVPEMLSITGENRVQANLETLVID